MIAVGAVMILGAIMAWFACLAVEDRYDVELPEGTPAVLISIWLCGVAIFAGGCLVAIWRAFA